MSVSFSNSNSIQYSLSEEEKLFENIAIPKDNEAPSKAILKVKGKKLFHLELTNTESHNVYRWWLEYEVQFWNS